MKSTLTLKWDDDEGTITFTSKNVKLSEVPEIIKVLEQIADGVTPGEDCCGNPLPEGEENLLPAYWVSLPTLTTEDLIEEINNKED